MSDQGNPGDPQVILWDLPEREWPEFLRQYRAAAGTARGDASHYRDLQRLLCHWRLVTVAANRPGYYEAIEEAEAGEGRTVPLGQALADEFARRTR
ncbi:DUF6247 family protein [Spongiactinospora gelatinilytica]|uniref:DUF6247 family protein n=1 Tax=Spongiactinospora gelatinilytica TaxID=2666298 RepID=UPI0011B94292|nr:DUF6247 family protein [Spongiactinospora gelatinilytica]